MPGSLVAGTKYILNVTFAQAVTATGSSFLNEGLVSVGHFPTVDVLTQLFCFSQTDAAAISQGMKANNLVIDLDYEGKTELEFLINFSTNYPEEQLCLYDIDCNYTSVEDYWAPKSINGVVAPLNLTIEQVRFWKYKFRHYSLISLMFQNYDAIVEYECGYGRGFDISDWPGDLPTKFSMKCNGQQGWDYVEPVGSSLIGKSFPTDPMPLCVCEYTSCSIFRRQLCTFLFFSGTHCIDPPIPDTSTQMFLNETVNVTALFDFGTIIDYHCLPERFFIDDDTKEKESLTCTEGLWNGTLGSCLSSEMTVELGLVLLRVSYYSTFLISENLQRLRDPRRPRQRSSHPHPPHRGPGRLRQEAQERHGGHLQRGQSRLRPHVRPGL